MDQENKRDIFIGDIHGCFDEFLLLLNKLQYNPNSDQLYLLGDMINKGPKNKEVLKFIEDENPNVIMGNHEYNFLSYCQEDSPAIISKDFENLKKELGNELDFWLHKISHWPFYIEKESFIVVHAGFVPNFSLDQTSPEILTTIRTWDGQGKDLKNENNPPWYQFYRGDKKIIYGHWAKQGLLINENTIGLDSGCVYGGHLSAWTLPDEKLYQVKALKRYKDIS